MRLKPMVSAIIFLRFIRFRLNLHAAEAGGVSMSFHTASTARGSVTMTSDDDESISMLEMIWHAGDDDVWLEEQRAF